MACTDWRVHFGIRPSRFTEASINFVLTIREGTKYAPRAILDTGASRVPIRKIYWEAYFSMIYLSGFLGLYEFVEVS